jgi:hypothetical protein
MPKYMLLLHSDPSGFTKLSPEEMQKATEKYMEWTKRSFVLDSKRLTGEPGRVIRANNGQARSTDGPYSATKEILGGYYTIEAADYDDAVRLATDHPHLANGGTIEVRHVFGT